VRILKELSVERSVSVATTGVTIACFGAGYVTFVTAETARVSDEQVRESARKLKKPP
jgi:hypothetical protein